MKIKEYARLGQPNEVRMWDVELPTICQVNPKWRKWNLSDEIANLLKH